VADEERWTPKHGPWLIAVSVMLPTFMEVLDTSIAAVALPYIGGSLAATNDEATWVLTSYLIANGVVLPASGWFALRFGRKRFLISCIVIFTIASFATAAANSLTMILIARAIQGAGGGALQPLSQAILLESFPPQKRGSAMALFALGVVVAPVLGPTLGGWLADAYSWRWAFYLNIPIGAVAILMISRFVEDPPWIRDAKVGRLDGIGLGLLALWLAALQIVLDKGQEEDWLGSRMIQVLIFVCVVGFVAFLLRQLLHPKPLVDLSVFRNRNFALGSILIGLLGAMLYGIVTLLPLFYQTLMGYSATAAGLAVAPRGLGAIVVMPIIAIFTSRVDNRILIGIGFALLAATTWWLGNLTLQISQWSELWPILLSGSATGLVFVPLATTAHGTLTDRQIGNATGVFNLLRNVGGGIGISTLNAIVIRRTQVHRNVMVGHLTVGRLQFDQRVGGLQRLFSQTSGPDVAAKRALRIANLTLDRQAAYWAYVDVFRYIVVACLCCLPMLLLLKSVKAKPGAGMAE
jgi:DHA2 family multidrug resistance protein